MGRAATPTPSRGFDVHRLVAEDASRYVALRLRMLELAPWAFAATPDDDPALDPAFVGARIAERHNALFVAETVGTVHAGRFVGAIGLIRQRPQKFAHRARLWGFFVEPTFRNGGIGQALMDAALDLARAWHGVSFVDAGVSENSPAAHALYAKVGFVEWGREPDATEYRGARIDEIHMALRL